MKFSDLMITKQHELQRIILSTFCYDRKRSSFLPNQKKDQQEEG